MSKSRDDEWAEAKRRCRLTGEAIRMAKELGMSPRSVMKNIPNPKQRWKSPVEDWIRNFHYKRFGSRRSGSTQPQECPSLFSSWTGPGEPPPEALAEPAPGPYDATGQLQFIEAEFESFEVLERATGTGAQTLRSETTEQSSDPF